MSHTEAVEDHKKLRPGCVNGHVLGPAHPKARMKAAIWTRTSTTDQEPENQARQLEAWAERRGLEVVKSYTVQESAWRGAHLKALAGC